MLFWFVLQKFVLAVLFISIIPPPQPPAGAGGADYICGVKSSVYGSREKQFWIFEPEGTESAPVVIFLHGWSAMTPEPYLLWIEHITKKGKIVIYPRYQRDIFTGPEDFTPNAIEEIRDAIEVLATGDHTKPELDKIAVVGHSAGGIIAANIAATAQSSLSQQVKALMCVEPGITERDGRKVVPLYDLASIPEIPMLVVVGDRDKNVGDRDARKIFTQSTDVKTKNYVIVHSDSHGEPELIADHYAPLALKGSTRALNNTVNALDYYGFWKLFDGLCDYAFYGMNREYAFGNTEEQRFMGFWSDGTPVKELEVYEEI